MLTFTLTRQLEGHHRSNTTKGFSTKYGIKSLQLGVDLQDLDACSGSTYRNLLLFRTGKVAYDRAGHRAWRL